MRLYDGDADARATATAALERLLKLLHPLMPHVTEEIWSHLPARASRLIVAAWPEAGDDGEAAALQRVQEAAQVFRRSGVVPVLEGDEQRIFAAVVKPDRAPPPVDGKVDAERARLQQEIARCRADARERALRPERPGARRRRRAREARALSPRARCARGGVALP